MVTNWTNEEGTRFAPAMLASGVFAGMHELDWAYARQDAEGKTFGDELERIGWNGEEAVGARKMHAFFELHIEQGPILEAEGSEIGVVTHGQGLWWLEVRLTGKDAHTGSTPMEMRVNAGLGMARITEAVHRIAMDHQPDAVGAVGQANVYPNSRNVIPGRAVFTVDFRSPDLGKLTAMRERAGGRGGDDRGRPGPRDRDRADGAFRSGDVRRGLRRRRAPRGGAAGLFPPRHRVGRGPRRLLDQPGRADRDGHVPLRGRPQPQRGRGDHPGLGARRCRRAVPCRCGDRRDRAVRRPAKTPGAAPLTRLIAVLPLFALAACVALPPFPGGLGGAPAEPLAPPPLPPAVAAALPPGAPQSTVIKGPDGCYLFSIEQTDPPTGYPIRDALGNPMCEGNLPPGPVAIADTSTPPEPLAPAQ